MLLAMLASLVYKVSSRLAKANPLPQKQNYKLGGGGARTWEAEAGGFLSSRTAWSTEWVPGQPELYRETLSRKTKKTKPNQTNKQETKILTTDILAQFL